jgi:hypothetical protein
MTNRTSKTIETEMEALRAKIKDLEAQKAEHVKALDKAKADRKRSAYSAHGDKDAKAQERLAKARAAQRESEFALEDLESAIAEGRARFERLEHEWHKALADEAWAALMAEAELARKEAEQIDIHASAIAKLLGAHGRRLEHLKNTAHNLGFERVFQTVGLRHFDRVFAWKMIQMGFAGEYEKPSEQYREAAGYSQILGQQIASARAAHDRAMKERESDGRGGDGPDHEPASPPESEAGAEAGTGA